MGIGLAWPETVQPSYLTSTMEADLTEAFDRDDATGSTRSNGLRLEGKAKVQRKKSEPLRSAAVRVEYKHDLAEENC